jgi:tryptophan synthase beta subunit
MKKAETVVVAPSGRGDKDVHTVGEALERSKGGSAPLRVKR